MFSQPLQPATNVNSGQSTPISPASQQTNTTAAVAASKPATQAKRQVAPRGANLPTTYPRLAASSIINPYQTTYGGPIQAHDEQVILRVPEDWRECLVQRGCRLDAQEVSERVFRCTLQHHEFCSKSTEGLYGKLFDLPTPSETHLWSASTQSNHLWKTANVSQILIINEEINSESEHEFNSLKIEDRVRPSFLWPSGLSPPLSDFYRKRKLLNSEGALEVSASQTAESIELIVESLLEADSKAEAVRVRILDGSEIYQRGTFPKESEREAQEAELAKELEATLDITATTKTNASVGRFGAFIKQLQDE